MTVSDNPQIKALLEGLEASGVEIESDASVSISSPGDARMMKLMRGGKLAAVVILQDLRVMGYRLFIETDGFTVPCDVETILNSAR